MLVEPKIEIKQILKNHGIDEFVSNHITETLFKEFFIQKYKYQPASN